MAYNDYDRRYSSYTARARPHTTLPRPVAVTSTTSRSIDENILSVIKPVDIPATTPNTSVAITNFRSVASYNWLEESSPTIVVPGSPPVWKSKSLPYAVPRDSGFVYVDQNSYRMPSSPLSPLISAVRFWEPSFDLSAVDIVTDRNNLRKLLRWIDRSDKDFRVDLDITGSSTVLFTRWEPRPREISGPGFGHSFEKAATSEVAGCANSAGHHRIITYEFSGLKLLVRFEVDACLPPHRATTTDDLADQLGRLSVGSTKASATSSTPSLRIIPAGNSLVPQADIIELKTRSQISAANFDWTDTWPQLFLSQTPHMYLAIHNRGTFTSVQKQQFGVTQELVAAERRAGRALQKLGAALQWIRGQVLAEAAKEKGQGRALSLIYRGGKLTLHERRKVGGLTDDLLACFE